jgi:type IV pilus assembly protein PilN
MIRINLLPQAKRQTGDGVGLAVWGYAYLLAAAVWCIALAFVYFSLSSDRDQALAQNKEINRQIKKIKEESGDLEKLQKDLDQSKQLEGVVKDLLAARAGPARMLLELSSILTPGRGPTVDPKKLEELRKVNPDANFTPGWDTNRLWIDGFNEENGKCEMTGAGRNNEDIAEFLRRLTLSEVFDNVVLVRTGAAAAGKKAGSVALVAFELTCKVRY